MATTVCAGGGAAWSRGSDHRSPQPARRLRLPAEATLRHITACVDGSDASCQVLGHACAVATAFGLPVSVLHVVETHDEDGPADPLDWHLRRLEARQFLEDAVAGERTQTDVDLSVELREGNAAEQILQWATARDGELTVLSRHGCHSRASWAFSSTARKLVEATTSSILVVSHESERASRPISYRRVLVPLDGSLRAESALAAAVGIARAHDAELLIAHGVPPAALTQAGPPTSEDLAIARQVAARNEQVGREYLRRLRTWLAERMLRVRAFTLPGGEVRERLAEAVAREGVDLVVLTAHGHTSPRGVSCGSVASYLLDRLRVPVLVLREWQADRAQVLPRADPTAGDPRQPARAR